jgi:IclR family mhp operon transcriptional activator
MDEDQELRSLKRGLRALTLLNAREKLSIAEVARALSIPRTTAERVMMTLMSEGYIVRDPSTKAFQLAPKVCALSAGFSDENWITHIATPLLFRLTERIGWPLAIATPLGERMIVRITTDPATSLHITRRYVGTEIAMMRASSAFAMLAFMPEHEREVLLGVLRRSPDPEQALARDERRVTLLMNQVRRTGIAFSPDGGKEGSISVPIFLNGKVKAALLMMYIVSAVKQKALLQEFYPQLRKLADDISRRASTHEVPGTAAE